MGISYGGVELLYADDGVSEYLERYAPLSDMRDLASWANLHDGHHRLKGNNANGTTVFRPCYPNPPQLRVNQLYWPTGATRFALGYFLVDDDGKRTIEANVLASNGTLSPLLFTADYDQTLNLNLYTLAPRPIFTGGECPLWLLTLVDERYFWQYRNLGDTEFTTSSTWDNVYATLATALGVPIDVDAGSSSYLQPDPSELTRRYDNPAVMLDAVAHSLGQRVVRDFNGTVAAQGWDNAKVTQAENFSGAAFTPWSGIAGARFDRHPLPANVSVVFPQLIDGSPEDNKVVAYTKLPSSSLPVVSGATKMIYSTAWANMTDAASGETSNTPVNSSSLDGLATVIAADYYASLTYNYDQTFAGLKKWQPCGYDDHILYWFGVEREGDSHVVTTRVLSSPFNFASERQLSQDPAAEATRGCPENSKKSLCLETANSTIKIDIRNGELCVREIPDTGSEATPADNCNESYAFNTCDCEPNGGDTIADCPCYDGDIDAVTSGDEDVFDAYDTPNYLPTHPENDPSLISTDGQVFYRFDLTEHWWLWKQEVSGRIEFVAAYWEESGNAIIKRINCENETVTEVATTITLDGGTA